MIGALDINPPSFPDSNISQFVKEDDIENDHEDDLEN